MALAVAMERFLAVHLGGYVQESVPAAVQERLDAITVDVDTVQLPGREEEALRQAAATGPLPEADGSRIKPTNLEYKGQMAVGPQTIDYTISRAIDAGEVEGRACWTIVDTSQTPMGTQTDTYTVDAGTLAPVKREVSAGAGTITLNYSAASIRGSMGQAGQSLDIDQPLEAPVMADGPGLEVALAALPLAEGYSTTLRYFEPMTQRVRLVQLTVSGTATAEVAGGSFSTLVVEVAALDDDAAGSGTVHVMAEAPHHVVRSEYKLPAMMGGGTRTAELASWGGGQ